MALGKQGISTTQAPQAIGPYSQAIIVGDFIFVSGQIALDKDTGTLISGSIENETEQALRNIQAILASAGSDLSKVVKATIFLRDMANFQKVNEVYGRFFKELPPARSCIGVKDLPRGAGVEIEVVAIR